MFFCPILKIIVFEFLKTLPSPFMKEMALAEL